MNINIQGRHLAVTPALHGYIREKIQKIKYYFSHIINVHIVLSLEKLNQIAEATISIESHHFHNKIASDDMYKSIDVLFDKLERQVRRYKEYIQSKGSSRRQRYHEELAQAKTVHNKEIIEIEVSAKPMRELEAVLQLNLDKKGKCIGFYTSENDKYPAFLEKGTRNKFKLIYWDQHWEIKELELTGNNKLIINSARNINLVSETIEDAAVYIKNHKDSKSRFFCSLRSGAVMFLFKYNNKSLALIREAIR